MLLAIDEHRHVVDLRTGFEFHVTGPADHSLRVGVLERAVIGLGGDLVDNVDMDVIHPDLHRQRRPHEAGL